MNVVLVPGCNARTIGTIADWASDLRLILTVLSFPRQTCGITHDRNVRDLPQLQLG
jgi:hypothetical protein